MMGKADDFLQALINYEKENIPEMCQKAIVPYLRNPDFDPDKVNWQWRHSHVFENADFLWITLTFDSYKYGKAFFGKIVCIT